MKILVIINDSPYGIERCYNGLRLANSLAKRDGSEVKVFLIGDAAGGARSGQKVPQGFYNVEVMLKNLVRAKAEIGFLWHLHRRSRYSGVITPRRITP